MAIPPLLVDAYSELEGYRDPTAHHSLDRLNDKYCSR